MQLTAIRHRSAFTMAAILLLARAGHSQPADASKPLPGKVIEINKSTKLEMVEPGTRLVITASDITIDGNGLTLSGAEGNPKTFKGTAISAKGVSGVTLKNIKARGWETGLKISDGERWKVEECDFSGNFHDPEFGWGENGRRGGIVLDNVHRSSLSHNKANNVWDACVLVDCNENILEGNDFSHTSNTCLKLWHSSSNSIRKNNLSYGIRIKPGEVHARDSTSVLIESGSNRNHLVDNDCTHGGDGIFVRVLNGWCSTHNVFERNDCSYANNNGVECWARDNQFLENKANHCSYGFWLGGSDHTRLERNEASYNGLKEGHHNSPHLPGDGHAGIVFMFGPSSHSVAVGNKCIGNNGAGIAIIGDLASKGKKWKAYHWIVEDNLLAHNRWGLYLNYADWIHVRGNRFDEKPGGGNSNSVEAVRIGDGVTRLTMDSTPFTNGRTTGDSSFQIDLKGPSFAKVGQRVEFKLTCRAKDRDLAITWDFGDGTTSNSIANSSGEEAASMSHTFDRPGFYRVGVTVPSSAGTELGWIDFYVVDDLPELGTEGDAAHWSIEDFHDRKRSNEQTSRVEFVDDPEERLAGKSSLRAVINPYAGFRAALTYPKQRDARWPLRGKSHLVFWMKVINEDVTGWQGGPFIVLHGPNDQKTYIEPRQGMDLMRQIPDNEGRDGWRRMVIPLSGNEQWQTDGPIPEELRAISLAFDSWGAPTLRIWIDGLSIQE